jgi:ABC-type Zn2+ transport system substrate-binding protein/surface adhesin
MSPTKLKHLMNKIAQLIFTEIATTAVVAFALSSASPVALAGMRGTGFTNGARDHDHDHDLRINNDHRFDRDHRHFWFPYWWYDAYGYDYAYDAINWQELAMKVQSQLTQRGYYHGPINGVIDSNTRQAIRAFQKANGLRETGLVDPGLLTSLKLSVPRAF